MNKSLFLLLSIFLCIGCGNIKNLKQESLVYERELQQNKIQLSKNDVLNRSENGNWQLRISGNPYELGYKKGVLTESLYQNQERVFFGRVAEMVPDPSKQNKLIKFLKWYNWDMLSYVPLLLKQELYALSSFGTDEFDDIGTPFERNLLLHSAHDIGHAMQDLMLVGCSSVALWGEYTADGKLLIGRNFDFYVNDAFAENKIVEFIQPEKGYKYASVTWPGMIGVVSGMNEKGLTVTLNAGKSDIPLRGKTPVSIVARVLLQSCKNIEEAIALAQQFEVFVSESFLIGSAEDNRAVVMEMSPKKFDVYEVDNGKLLCTNHFQSDDYQTDKHNQQQIETSHSYYRLQKLEESFQAEQIYIEKDVLKVLRDVSGINNESIGLGNEKALNQLMAHHGVIFKPAELKMWVSNNPYQLGTFDGYDLNIVFQSEALQSIKELEFPADDFLQTKSYQNYQKFKRLDAQINIALHQKKVLSTDFLKEYEQSNPDFWLVSKRLGDYYYQQSQWKFVERYYKKALQKEISSEDSRKYIEKRLKRVQKKK